MGLRLSFLAAVLLALIASVPAGAQESGAAIRLTVGAAKTITLQENPSTGFKWRINTAQSSNLAAVQIDDMGYAPGPGDAPGSPGVHRWRIGAKAPGLAQLVFEYARPWEQVAPARRHTVRVKIARSR